MLLYYVDMHVIILCGYVITLGEHVIILCGHVITLGEHVIILCGHVITLCGHVILFCGYLFNFVMSKLLPVMWLLFYVMCKHHIIILNFSMTKITKVIADAERAGWKWPIFILLCIERSGISDLGIYIRPIFIKHKFDSLETCGPLTDDQLINWKQVSIPGRGGQIMTNSRSSVHRAIQGVRHGVFYSKFVEKKERDQIMRKVTLTLLLNNAVNRYIRSSNMFRYKK